MLISAYPCSVPKAGNSVEEYEDAYCPADSFETAGDCFRFAVADGATEASYSKIWAHMLVESYCNGVLKGSDLENNIQELQIKWDESVRSRPLPWYAEEKVRTGAFSSLLGLTITHEIASHEETGGLWEAEAVGDSCLFQVRDDELLTKFPLDHSEQFNSRPMLVSTNSTYNEGLSNYLATIKGSWLVGDVFYLFTDALACWFLKEVEDSKKPWKFKHADPGRFETWINKLRKKGAMRNDDVTMFRIEIMSEDNFE